VTKISQRSGAEWCPKIKTESTEIHHGVIDLVQVGRHSLLSCRLACHWPFAVLKGPDLLFRLRLRLWALPARIVAKLAACDFDTRFRSGNTATSQPTHLLVLEPRRIALTLGSSQTL